MEETSNMTDKTDQREFDPWADWTSLKPKRDGWYEYFDGLHISACYVKAGSIYQVSPINESVFRLQDVEWQFKRLRLSQTLPVVPLQIGTVYEFEKNNGTKGIAIVQNNNNVLLYSGLSNGCMSADIISGGEFRLRYLPDKVKKLTVLGSECGMRGDARRM